MSIKKTEVIKILEGIINRLDEFMTDSLVISEYDEVGYKTVDSQRLYLKANAPSPQPINLPRTAATIRTDVKRRKYQLSEK